MIATHNPGKLAEMRDLLSRFGVEAVSAGELGLGVEEHPVREHRHHQLLHVVGQHVVAAEQRGSRLPQALDG